MDTAVMPALATVPGVELARTGRWALSSGDWQPTREDFHSAVAAMSCPAVRPPRIRLGHVDPRFDGEPAAGSIINLRTEYGGHSLVGDLDELPAWLANRDDAGRSVLSSAYPDRSVEGTYNYRCQLGHTHPFVLTGLALLGVTPPGVGTLRSLRDVATRYGVEASPEPADGTPVSATFRASAEVHTGAMVALVPSAAHTTRLAVDGGEPGEQLHLTLAYLGDAINIDEATRRATITALATAMTGAGTVDADGFAISAFNPTSDERDTCIVLGVSGAEVDDAQSLTMQTLAKVPGLVVPQQHLPFAAHVTLTYTDDLAQVAPLADRTGPISFDRLRVAFGGVVTDIPLGPTVVEARYDPGQRRDRDGQWTGGAPDATGGAILGKLSSDDGLDLEVSSAADGGASLRFPFPDDGGNPFDRVDLSPASVARLRSDLADAEAARRAHAAKVKAADRRFSAAEEGTPEYEAAQAAWFDLTDGYEISRGSVPGEHGGTLHWAVVQAEEDTSFWAAIEPPGAGPDWRFHEEVSDGVGGTFPPSAVAKLRKHLDKIGAVVARFDPHQHRDNDGKWSDSSLDAPDSLPDARGMTWEQVHDLYGDTYDEATVGDFTAAVFTNGDFTFFYRNESGGFETVRELTPEDARDLADQLEWAAGQEELRDGGYEPTDELIDFMPVDDEQTGLVGYSGDGDVRLAFSRTGDYVPGLQELGNPDVDSYMFTADMAVDLADMLRDMADRHDELDVDEYVTAAADRNALKRYWTTGEGKAKWVGHPHPWRALFSHLRKFMPVDMAKRTASQWYYDVLGHWPSEGRRKKQVAATTGRTPMAVTSTIPTPDSVRAAWNSSGAPDTDWVTEIAPDCSYVVVVSEPDRTFTRHQVHVSAGGRITFGRGRPIRLGYVEAAGAVTATRTVFASRAESRPVAASDPATTPADPAPELPAAEPEPTITEPKEGDPMSTLSTDVRSRLGLTDDADDTAILAALDALKTKAETPPPAVDPDPATVAAAAETAQKNAEQEKEIAVLASRLDAISTELAATKAEQAATVKASVLGEAKRLGKIAPADEDRWSKDYDDAPAVITRVLASIAPGTAVPVSAAGVTGPAEPSGATNWDEWDAEMARLSGPVSSKGSN